MRQSTSKKRLCRELWLKAPWSKTSGTNLSTINSWATWPQLREVPRCKRWSLLSTSKGNKNYSLCIYSYGPLRLDAWSRYFYNEVTYRGTEYSTATVDSYNVPWKCNLCIKIFISFTISNWRRQTEVRNWGCSSLIALPRCSDETRVIAYYLMKSEKIDFERIYAIHALKTK
jgi:hypothetical protein